MSAPADGTTAPSDAPQQGPLPRSVSALITAILAIPSTPLGPTQFQFHLDHASAIHNGKILAAHNFDLSSAIRSDGNSPLRFGSEFRPPTVLQSLLEPHPLWPRIEALLQHGSHFSADSFPSEQCLDQVDAALAYGNHKGATKDPDKLFELLDEDVTHGFNLPLPLAMARRIPGLLISPMNIVRQNTINELGDIVEKDRLTHDHTMEFMPQSSINSRSRMDDHEPCHFGHALQRIFHFLVHLRLKHPTKRIMMTKVDWKAAYRRVHMDIDTALQCCTSLEDILLCALRLTFGGRPAPPDFSCISDTASDIANDLVVDPSWDPTTLCSPHQPKMPPVPPNHHPPSELPHPGQPLLFDFPVEESERDAKFDNYIDDELGAAADIDDAILRLAAAGPLALHVLGRPLSDDESILRDDVLSLKKFFAEALPEESKIMLGWLIDAWNLTVALPQDKYLGWSKSIRRILEVGKVCYGELDELIGRLQHLCRVMRPGTHFMGRLRSLLASFNGRKYASRHLDREHVNDLKLFLKFMKVAAAGVSLNILVLRVPSHLYRCDASLHGIGGYSSRGRAWRFVIPTEFRLRASINLLEFFGSIIGPWLDFIEGQLPPEASIFSQGDNTTAAAWLHKTNFDSKKPVHLKAARRLANLLLEAKAQLVGEWIPGDTNGISDSLSRDSHLPIAEHTALLRSHFSHQMPDGFQISPLPDAIKSWVCSLLQLLPASQEPCPPPTPSKLVSGADGSLSSAPSTDPTILSSSPSTPNPFGTSNLSSSAGSPKPCERANFKPEVVKAWLQAQSKVTSDRWYKPSGLLSGQTPPSTPTVNYPHFYHGSMPVTPVSTHPRSAKKPSASRSSCI
jgi:hypothetical protein